MNNISLWIITSFLATGLVVDGHRRLGSSPVAYAALARASGGGSGGGSGGAAGAASGSLGARYLSHGAYRNVGALQLVAAVGLMVPGLLRTATLLVPLSACGVIALLLWATDVRDLGSDPMSRAIVNAVAQIGHQRGLKVVAEWVDGEHTLAVLRELGVDYGQGFVLHRPQRVLFQWPDDPRRRVA